MVAHGGVLDILYRAATHLELQAPRTWQLTNTSVNRLLWTPQGLSLVGRIARGLEDLLARDGFASVAEAVGTGRAHWL